MRAVEFSYVEAGGLAFERHALDEAPGAFRRRLCLKMTL